MAAVTRAGVLIVLVAGLAVPARGQRIDTAVAGAHYSAGWFHRLFLGAHNRHLWTAPVEVPVLDLSRYAGGLTPTGCGGRRQTKSIRFLGGDGHQYVFRPIDKDPTLAMPPDLRETFVRSIIQDQISAAHPGGPLVVAPLLDAAQVLHASPQFVELPDDPRLGAVECAKPGLLGMIEERPTEPPDNKDGIAGAVELADTDGLFERLERNPANRIDSRAFLAARLMDVFIGDWDRHHDQWRWARFDSGAVRWWRPIPRDRDQAFTRLDGILIWLAGYYQPQLVGFGNDYPATWRITWSGRVVDRRLLTDLDRAVWDSVTIAIRARLTDSVIDHAVRQLPAAYYDRDGARLRQALIRRRDNFPDMSRRFYNLLAQEVEVHATDRADVATIERRRGGTMTVSLSPAGDDTPYYRRTFDSRETKDVRLFLHGGDDRVIVRGEGGPSLRVIGGAGNDAYADSARAGRTRFYDDRGTNSFVRGRNTSVDQRAYETPPIDTATLALPRDWGARRLPLTWVSYGPDLGLFGGGGFTRTGYNFRRVPYSSEVTFRAGYATTAQAYRAEFDGEWRELMPSTALQLRARASGIEILHFYGFGNESADSGSLDFHKVFQHQYLVAPALDFQLSRGSHLAVGPLFKRVDTDLRAGTLVDAVRPYGVTKINQVGAALDFEVDTRDFVAAATRGVALQLGGSVFPATLDINRSFGEAHGEARAYLSARMPLSPTLALRVGGKKVWGNYPLHEAAFLGGGASLRGFRDQRFAGDAVAFGSAELRFSLTRFYLLLPGRLGLFALADAGRVYLPGESSDKWHAATGGGLWFAFLNPANTVSIAAADAGGGMRVYARAGFGF
ncbi:MAG TPA: BamA/TamA family outer membrane protein [Gemmatimonadales bacterium]|nr:BamA/TamA family outer membrane protein [Gemmatimonadales bacterium]